MAGIWTDADARRDGQADALATVAHAIAEPYPSCLNVPSKGKPPCPTGQDAICAERVTCLTTKFPATSARPCIKWVCQPLLAPTEGTSKTSPKE